MVLAHGVKILPERQCDVSWPVELAYVSASGFGIQTGKRTLFLFCDTQRDAGTWLDILTGLTTFGVLPSALPFDATAPPPSAGVGPQPAVLGPAPTGPLPDLPESSEDEGLDGLARVPTVSLKRKTAKELSQLSRTLLTRTAGQEEQIIGLKAELAASERTCDALRGRVLALETQLRLLSSMPAPPSDSEGEGEGEMEGGGGGGRDGAANPTLHDAAITIQMWWRLIRMRRHFAHVKSLAQVRGRTRTVEARAAGHSDERMPAGRASLSNRNRRTPTWSANIQPLAETSEGRTPLYALARAPKSTQGRIDQPAVPKKMAPRTVAVAPKGVADAEASALAADALTLVPEDAPPPVGSYVSLDKIRERRRLSGVPSEPEGASGAQGQGGDGRAPALDKQAGAEASAAPGLVEPTSSSDASRAAANAAADAHAAAVAAAYAAEQVAPVVLPVESPYDEIVEEDEGRHARLFTLEVSPVAATAGGDDTAVRHARSAMYHFNKRPVKGIKTLISAGLVNGAPEAVAKFICEEPGLSRSAVGDFFGEADEFSQEVLKVYSENFDFTDASLDQSLRLFLLSFRIPGEAQKIERVLTEFSRRFFACNPDIFLHVDTALVLSFSVMMLHTDLHNPSNPRRMTMPEFVRNNRGIDDGQDLPKEYLEMIYRNIEAEEFRESRPIRGPAATEDAPFAKEVRRRNGCHLAPFVAFPSPFCRLSLVFRPPMPWVTNVLGNRVLRGPYVRRGADQQAHAGQDGISPCHHHAILHHRGDRARAVQDQIAQREAHLNAPAL